MKRQREIIILAISIFLVSIAWIGFDIYHNIVTSTISEPLQQAITDINPNFDTTVITQLKQRTYTDPIYFQGTASTSAKEQPATPSATITKQPSPSITPTVTTSLVP